MEEQIMEVVGQNSEVEKVIASQNDKMTGFDLITENSRYQPDFSWKIRASKENLKKDGLEMISEVFHWRQYPVQSRAKLETYGNQKAFLSLCLNEQDNSNTLLQANFIPPTVYYLLRDQVSSNDPQHKCREVSCLFGTKYVYSAAFLDLKSQLVKKLLGKNGVIVIDVYVEPPTMAQRGHSFDGTLNYSIGNYLKSKRLEKTWLLNCHESPYFYTGPSGYWVQVHMWLHGWGAKKENGLTAEIIFLIGKFDVGLPSTFKHQTAITLINRKNLDGNITKQVERDIRDGARYSMTLCCKEEIENVIENDSVFYSVTIKAI